MIEVNNWLDKVPEDIVYYLKEPPHQATTTVSKT